MSNIITIGYSTEGTTDKRFLEGIIKRTFEEIAFSCSHDIEVYDPIFIQIEKKGGGFIEHNLELARKAFNYGLHVVCVHVDADAENDSHVLTNKISPAFEAIRNLEESETCRNFVSVIPVYMSEAWMLADLELLKEEIGTAKSNLELQFSKFPEKINNPKAVIENALRIAQEELPKRRNKLGISELYQPVGQLLSLEKLSKLESYLKFKNNVVGAFEFLNYL